jgi:hypothetical protein
MSRDIVDKRTCTLQRSRAAGDERLLDVVAHRRDLLGVG